MTTVPASPPAQPVPPAEETTAQTPPTAAGFAPKRQDLVRPADGLTPRPSSLTTQEIRLALAFTGGVSLAVWMGGVARELNLLVQASGRRRRTGEPADPAEDPDPVRGFYRKLLDLVDAEVAIDVLAGTSAGGINCALLGLVNARNLDLGPLRDIWLDAGDFGKLMRDPAEASPPSLLRGDGQMLAALREGIDDLLDQQPLSRENPVTDVFITTTLLSPETGRFTDDYGTEIADTDHHGLFHFTDAQLRSDDIGGPLALAARSSASFPGAFEPSFVPYGTDTADDEHPDMSAYSNTTRSHWAADGGLLVNRPLAPLMQRMFDRSADREVRRALLYVAPTTGSPSRPEEDHPGSPLGLAGALRKDLGAALNQSIAADLAAIREHNDRVRAIADTGWRMAVLGRHLPRNVWLSDESVWSDYRLRQGIWIVSPLIAELSRQLTEPADALLAAARESVVKDWPTSPPRDADAALRAAVALGRPAFDSAKATMLRILRLARVVADRQDQRYTLAVIGRYASRPLSDNEPAVSRRDLVKNALEEAAAAGWPDPATWVGEKLTPAYWRSPGTEAALRAAWQELRGVFEASRGWLHELVKDVPELAGTTADRRSVAARTVQDHLRFLNRKDDVVAAFLDLHVVSRSVLPVLTEVAQPVELIQVSADTRTRLAPGRRTPESKLTGLQMHHFGAFYKPSWRANDWMWGRLDGCGWLVHILLDPRRILAVLENDGVKPADRVDVFLARLHDDLGVTVVEEDLAFLSDETLAVPASLPELAMRVAAELQKQIARDELTVVADQARTQPSPTTARWLAKVSAADLSSAEAVATLLNGCPVGRERIIDEAKERTPLFIRTATQAGAVATAAVTGATRTPTSLKPTFATARTITRTAYAVANQARGTRKRMVQFGLGMLILATVALFTSVPMVGLPAVVLFGAGAVVLGFALGPRVVDGLRVLLALLVLLLACAPWVSWLWPHVHAGLNSGIHLIDRNHWTWPVLLLLVLLPPASAIGNLVRRNRAQSADG